MTTDVGVPGGGRARDPLISLPKRRPAEAFKRTRPAARRDPRRRRDPSWTCASTDRTKYFSAGTCSDQMLASYWATKASWTATSGFIEGMDARSSRPRRMAFCMALFASHGEVFIGQGSAAFLAGRLRLEGGAE
jgi:hypothetical protein